jgi:predicted ester cyclase
VYNEAKGPLFGIAPIGKQGTVTGMDVYRFVGGKFEENWSTWDALGLMQQLGDIPLMGW